jgi:hypothetical protein
LKNIWPASTPELQFNFQIVYHLNKPPTGACTILTGCNPQPPVTSKPITPILPSSDTTTSDMVVVDSYQNNGKMKMKATCNLPIDTKLENFYILLLFTEDTSDLEVGYKMIIHIYNI